MIERILGRSRRRSIWRTSQSASWADDGIPAVMPVIATFFGIVIRMYDKEYGAPHFHAEHQAEQGKVDFDGH